MTKEDLEKELERLEIKVSNGDLASCGEMIGHLVNLSYVAETTEDEDISEEIRLMIDITNEASNNSEADVSSVDYNGGYMNAIHDVLKAFSASRKLDK